MGQDRGDPLSTWNLQWGKVSLSRSWDWEPKTGKVTYESKDKDGKPVTVTYMRSELATQTDAVKNDIEPAFVNDKLHVSAPFEGLLGLHPHGYRSGHV